MANEPTLADLSWTDVRNADAEILRLKGEVADLRELVAATFVGTGTGVVVLVVPPETRADNIASLRTAWGAVWPAESDAPPLLIAFGDLPIEKLEYDGSGLFSLRVPDSLSAQSAARIIDMWRSIWRRTDTPNAPLMLLAGDSALELLSDSALGDRGLMRVPSGLNFGG